MLRIPERGQRIQFQSNNIAKRDDAVTPQDTVETIGAPRIACEQTFAALSSLFGFKQTLPLCGR
jgi:hypothetical protein